MLKRVIHLLTGMVWRPFWPLRQRCTHRFTGQFIFSHPKKKLFSFLPPSPMSCHTGVLKIGFTVWILSLSTVMVTNVTLWFAFVLDRTLLVIQTHEIGPPIIDRDGLVYINWLKGLKNKFLESDFSTEDKNPYSSSCLPPLQFIKRINLRWCLMHRRTFSYV